MIAQTSDSTSFIRLESNRFVPDSRRGDRKPAHHSPPARGFAGQTSPRATEELLVDLLDSSLVLVEEWEKLEQAARREVLAATNQSSFVEAMVKHGLINAYQASRIEAGTTFGLILGNYRVLERIGAGGMGVVFKAEQIRLRRQVAIKVMPLDRDAPANLLLRFYSEVRTIAQLVHPNIVAAIDAGEVANPDPDGPTLHYFVMEYVSGQDLEQFILDRGPLPTAVACDVIQQVAAALAVANKHGIVHRDIKPSNILLTPEGQAKLLDFGLTRSVMNRVTEPGAVLGTVDFMAPEQVKDASAVDIRADLYGLGGTLYWCLAGKLPFPGSRNIAENLARRLTQPPPSIRAELPSIPQELDAIIARMMARDPSDRYSCPEAVREALLPWATEKVAGSSVEADPHTEPAGGAIASGRPHQVPPTVRTKQHTHQILVVDDEPAPRQLCSTVLRVGGLNVDEAPGGLAALEMVGQKNYDLLLLDINMPDLSGLEVCKRIRERQPASHIKIITVSGFANPDDLSEMMIAGADDFLPKPFSVVQLQARVKAMLRLKDAQDRSDSLNRNLLSLNQELQQNLRSKDTTLVDTRNALVLTLAKMVEQREGGSTARLTRLQHYSRLLAETAGKLEAFRPQLDHRFIDLLQCTAPLLDIGKVGLPDYILLKPGQLAPDERLIMQTHTAIGADLLNAVSQNHNSARGFMEMAVAIARHHHERYDGKGYPDQLVGDAIPLAARIVAPCDVYDALRSRRLYRPGLNHNAALQVLQVDWANQFDPKLREPFVQCAAQFDRIFREVGD